MSKDKKDKKKVATVVTKATNLTKTPKVTKKAKEPKYEFETFPNPNPGRYYEIIHVCEEFTSVCPKTGLPDFARVNVRYIPSATCLELKSMKYYFLEFRNKGIFYEAVTNKILDDLIEACDPEEMEIVTEWGMRGGMTSTIRCTHFKDSVEDGEAFNYEG